MRRKAAWKKNRLGLGILDAKAPVYEFPSGMRSYGEGVDGYRLAFLILWLSLILLTFFARFSFPIGSALAEINLVNVVIPLIATEMSFPISALLAGGVWITLHIMELNQITFGLPTLFAILSWRASQRQGVSNIIINALTPLYIIAVFVSSQAGQDVRYFSLYWLIPIICTFLKPVLLVRLLQSIFVQHAIGSLLWLYSIELPVDTWRDLFPVVAVERGICISSALVFILALRHLAKRICRRRYHELFID